MMSPLSVAQLIDRRSLIFDMVIFDEASQIRPEDALSSLARARQFVVVGDSLQLPPTSFGVKTIQTPDQDDEEEEDESPVVESILELCAAAYGQGPMLLWHYRSRDPSLIAYSNKEFYDRKLRLFPAPHIRSSDSGVHYVSVRGTYSARTNLLEAQQCAKAAIEFMRAYPNRSLGIVALNRPQSDLIEIELDRLVSQQPNALNYCERWDDSIEPLFVKNLESVQGDERDVIFISTVFGHDEENNFFQRFGPINSKAGHRRLNVLFTRAKHQVVVFSSIPLEKIVVGDGAKWGVKVLKEYLEFARSGRLEAGLTSGRSTESPFEEAVMSALRAEGIHCEPQVGVVGFYIDLAVRHPAFPDHFILGIECDGAAYHNTRAARDRDRLRQEILESLGWKLHRIWSTDWLANPRTELQKLIRAIRELSKQPPNVHDRPALNFLQPKKPNS
jgi:very-short-patch-repair endonuclease